MAYYLKEIFYSLQGEGAQAGRAAVFCRFAGCNLWSGREVDRATADCGFCDTNFVGTDGPGGGVFATAAAVAAAVVALWPPNSGRDPFVIATGGEPLLQLDAALLTALHKRNCKVAVETSGTLPLSLDIDWICVSPKAGTKLAFEYGDELKLVFPQDGLDPATFTKMDFRHFFLQPMGGPEVKNNTEAAVRYCLDHPVWRLGLQIHKHLGIP